MNWYKIAQEGSLTYTVISGDTLSSISKKLLNDVNRWPEIQKLNNITNPDIIQTGIVLKIPSKEVVAPIVENKIELKKENDPSQEVIDKESAMNMLKKEISKSEGGYGSYNRGVAGDTPKPIIDITKLTVAEIMIKQNKKLADGKKELFAVGKYQFIPVTLRESVLDKRVEVNESDLFNQDTQEKLFMHLIYKRPKLYAYISKTSNDIDGAINELAAEFASIPQTTGLGRYDKDNAGNKATGGLARVARIKTILKAIREQ